MALDSKQKRGSAINCGIPFRRWLAEPDGTLADTDRVSLMKWCSAIAPEAAAAAIVGPYYVAASQIFTAGAVAAEVFVPGHTASEVFVAGQSSSEVN